MAALDPNGTGNQYSSDSSLVGNLATALVNAQAALEYITVTFLSYNDVVVKTVTSENGDIYLGMDALAVQALAPANSEMTKDALQHHEYNWPAITEITDSATYKEAPVSSDHEWSDWVVTENATCLKEGAKERQCLVSACGYEEAETIARAEHTPGDAAVENKNPATCENPGSYDTVIRCTICNEVISSVTTTTDALEHSWDDGVITDAPSCTEEGVKTFTCKACGETKTETLGVTAHTEEIIPAVPATCTTPGKTEGKKCSVCDTVIVEPQDTALAPHTEEIIPAEPATCTAPGKTAGKKCSVCDAVLEAQTETEKLAHTMGNWSETKAPTCITAGEKSRKCNNCTYTETEAVAATGVHVYGKWTKYSATEHSGKCTADIACTATVTEAHTLSDTVVSFDNTYHHYKCEKCDVYGYLLNGVLTEHVKEECYGEGSVITEIKGNLNEHQVTCKCGKTKTVNHSWTEDVSKRVEATCTTNGSEHYDCSACGATKTETLAAGHKYVGVVTDPTCTADGYTTYTCSVCTDTYVGNIVSKSGHTAGDGATCTTAQTCTTCGTVLVDVLGHKYNKVVTNPTCTADGYTTYTCSVCNDTYVGDTVSTSGHSFTNYVSNNDATCSENGTATAKCDNCNETDTKVDENSTVDHKYVTYISDNNATCKDNATETAECAYGCGTEDTRAIENSTVDHKYETYTKNGDATCQKNETETAECAYGCGTGDTREIENSTVDHKYETYVSNNNATCKDNATETASCSYGCGTEYTRAIENSTVDHKYETYTKNGDATCQKNETETAECAYGCGTGDTREIENSTVDHKYETYTKNGDATCQKNATETASCSYGCGTEDTRAIENSTVDHKYETYVSNNNATCKDNATETASCSYGCGTEDTRAIENSTVDHKYETYTKNGDATCQKNETETAECAYGCGTEDTREIANSTVDHKYETYVSNNNATCKDNATETASCSYGCGKTDTKEIANSTVAHKFTSYTPDNNAECEEDGTKTALCDYGCGTKDTVTDIGSAKDHDMQLTEAKVEPKCEVPGKTAVYTCANGCGKTEGGEEIEAPGHNYGEATCGSPVTCTVCGETTGSALDHKWGEPELTKTPTANEPGEYTEKCKYCSETLITKVFFADYSELNDVTEQLRRLYNNNTSLTAAAQKILSDAIAEAEGISKNLVADVTTAGGKEIKGGQEEIDALVEKLTKVVTDTTDAIHDGSALVPDYSGWDAAEEKFNTVDKTRAMQKYLDEAAALIADIASKKANTAHTQASATQTEINEAAKRLGVIAENIRLKAYVEPDYSAIETAVSEYEALTPATEVLASIKEEAEEIKNAYAEIKSNADANEYAHQGQLNALAARLNEIIEGITDTSLIKPDYAEAIADLNTVKTLAENNTLLDGVENDISDIEAKLNNIIGNDASDMKTQQEVVDALDTELKALIEDITDGKLVKPDYSAADTAVSDTDNIGILTAEERATIDGLKSILNSIKNDASSNKYDDQLTVDSIAAQINAIYVIYKDCLPDNHDYTERVVAPLCGEDGYTEYTCNRCGYSYLGNFVAATTQHDWDDGVLTRPTATTDGYYTYTCKNTACGVTKVEKVVRADYSKYDEAVARLEALIASGSLTDSAKAETEAALNDARITDGYITSEQSYVDAAVAVLDAVYASVTGNDGNYKPDYTEVNELLDKYADITSKVEIPEDIKAEIDKAIEDVYAIMNNASSNKKEHQATIDGLADTIQSLIGDFENCAKDIHRDKDDDGLCDNCGKEFVEGADGCICHKGNIFSKIVRLLYSILSWLFQKNITCCPDMEFYFDGISGIT